MTATMLQLSRKQRIEAEGFIATFDLYPVYDDWQQELYNYFIMGFEPGGFHSALFACDLNGAAFRSHPSNQWKWIQGFIKWNYANAPGGTGSYVAMKEWLLLDEATRRKYCEKKGLILPAKKLAWRLLEETHV